MDDKKKDHINPENPLRGTALKNYTPMTCLPMMWKILSAQIREMICDSLTNHGLFPEEQKGCIKWIRDTGELLYIDQQTLNESKTRKNLAGLTTKWLDNKLTPNVQVIRWNHKLCRVTAGGKTLAEAKIHRGIFQGEALSPLLFVIAMMPLNLIFRKCAIGYKLSKS